MLVVFYLLSTIAGCKRKEDFFTIFMINLSTRFTIIGWFISLYFALTEPSHPRIDSVVTSSNPKILEDQAKVLEFQAAELSRQGAIIRGLDRLAEDRNKRNVP